MIRKHREIGFGGEDIALLSSFTEQMEQEEWTFLPHALEKMEERCRKRKKQVGNIIDWIKNASLRTKDIFEAYFDNGRVLKTCYRMRCSDTTDMILVVAAGRKGKGKELVTVYWNNHNNNHKDLDKNLYGR